MRKLTLSMLVASAALTIAGCNREPAEEANTAVVEETEVVPPAETADNLDVAAENLDNAAENMDNAAENAAEPVANTQ